MSFSQILPRDASDSDSGTNIVASAVTKGCNPVATWLKLCPRDFAAVVGIVFFICYVLWGVPLTIRLFKYCKASLSHLSRRRRSYSDASSMHSKDLEDGSGCDLDSEFDCAYIDPYHSPTRQLHNFLHRSSYVLIPAPIASPKDKILSQPAYSPDLDGALRAERRLAQFRFPPLGSSRPAAPRDTFSMYSRSDTIHSSTSRHTHKTTSEELDELVFNYVYRDPRALYGCSTPPGSSKRRSSGSDSFVMFDMNSYKSSDDLLESSYGTESVELPASPPPAYLDQNIAFGSPARLVNRSF